MAMDAHWLLSLVWVFLGSGLGGMARHGLSMRVAARVGEKFPWGTLSVNVTGAFLIGWVAYLPWLGSDTPWAESARVLLIFGFLGGYTTVSSFSLQTLLLLNEGRPRAALANAGGSWALCLGAAFVGAGLGRIF